MKAMSNELRNCFDKVVASHTAATVHYQIWFALRGEGKALKKYYDEMNDSRYVDFFYASSSGNYKLMFIETASLFDPDKRAASIRNLKQLLLQEDLISSTKKFDESLGCYSALVSNIRTVRSKIIAHKDINTDPASLYQKHGIRPDDIRELLRKCGELLQEIEKIINSNSSGSYVCTTNRFERATFAMLETLKNGRN